jgi:hypothetical protein
MAKVAEEAILYQIKRSLRPDWRRFWKPGHENDPLYKLYESAERKFDANQPRVPKGEPEGGQWTSDGGSDQTTGSAAAGTNDQQTSDVSTTADTDNQLGGLKTADRATGCLAQYKLDVDICRIVRTASCWRQAGFRLGQCMAGGYIPPIYH